uniref:Uncharacterized protein n=1 Tax=Chrysotila carterae TaxID=13221 RepID=A0A7S4BAI9_CHRCT
MLMQLPRKQPQAGINVAAGFRFAPLSPREGPIRTFTILQPRLRGKQAMLMHLPRKQPQAQAGDADAAAAQAAADRDKRGGRLSLRSSQPRARSDEEFHDLRGLPAAAAADGSETQAATSRDQRGSRLSLRSSQPRQRSDEERYSMSRANASPRVSELSAPRASAASVASPRADGGDSSEPGMGSLSARRPTPRCSAASLSDAAVRDVAADISIDKAHKAFGEELVRNRRMSEKALEFATEARARARKLREGEMTPVQEISRKTALTPFEAQQEWLMTSMSQESTDQHKPAPSESKLQEEAADWLIHELMGGSVAGGPIGGEQSGAPACNVPSARLRAQRMQRARAAGNLREQRLARARTNLAASRASAACSDESLSPRSLASWSSQAIPANDNGGRLDSQHRWLQQAPELQASPHTPQSPSVPYRPAIPGVVLRRPPSQLSNPRCSVSSSPSDISAARVARARAERLSCSSNLPSSPRSAVQRSAAAEPGTSDAAYSHRKSSQKEAASSEDAAPITRSQAD